MRLLSFDGWNDSQLSVAEAGTQLDSFTRKFGNEHCRRLSDCAAMVQKTSETDVPQLFSSILNLGELSYCQQLIDSGAWKMTNWSGSKPTERRFWIMDLTEDALFTDTVFERIQKVTGKKFELRNVYANGQTFGHDGDFHTDGADPAYWTFVIYVSEVADGGHTLFRIPGSKILAAVEPVKNTGVLFKASLVHKGLAPSRDCNGLRVTIAYKLRVKEP